jgi:hypothetical protein
MIADATPFANACPSAIRSTNNIPTVDLKMFSMMRGWRMFTSVTAHASPAKAFIRPISYLAFFSKEPHGVRKIGRK